MKKILWTVALVAAAVLGTETSASAQFGVLNSLGKAVKEAAEGPQIGIPKPQKKDQKVIFTWGDTPIGWYNPKTLEIIFNQKWDEGELAGKYVIYKIDAQTGDIVRNDGTPKGKIYADGTFESPNLGTLRLEGEDFEVWRGEEKIGSISPATGWCFDHKLGFFEEHTHRQVIAVTYFGLLTSENQINQWREEQVQRKAEEAAQAAEARRVAEERAQYEREHPTFYEVRKGSGRGYVDSNGVVYDWSKTKIGELPKGNGDIKDKYGNTIGTVSFGGEDIKDRSGKFLCVVKSSGTICDGSQQYVPYASIGVYGAVEIDKDKTRLGECNCKNPTWTAILVYCDFFKF